MKTRIVSCVLHSTVFGSLQFVVAFSEVPSAAWIVTHASYADDTNVSQKIQTHSIIALLQQELESIYRWAKNNNMQFNAVKFQALI